MTKITGYARQREPKWLYFSIITLAIVIISLALYAFFAVYGWMESESLKKLQAEAARTTSSTAIVSAESTTTTALLIATNAEVAVENITFKKENGMVYCYTRVKSSVLPATIRHVWISPSGAVAADIKLEITRSPAETWSYSSQPGTRPGKWELQVKTAGGKIVGKSFLTVVND